MNKVFNSKRQLLTFNLLTAVKKQNNSILWVSAVAFGALVPAIRILISGHTLVWRDTSKLFQPIRYLVVEALRDFRLPLWNPYEALGIPLFAQMMHGVLHPVSLIGAFAFPRAGMDIFILIYIVFAAVGSALLARVLGASRGSAAVTGLGYGLSGYVLGMASVIQYLGAAASAPWALMGLRIAGERRRFGIVAAAVAVAVLHFAGDPEWTIIAVLMGTALAVDTGGMKGLRNVAIGVAIGTALAGIQLIPTMTYLRQTVRATGLDSLDRLQWVFSPWRIIEFIAPGFFGSSGAGLEKWPVFMWLGGQIRTGFEMPFVPSVYIGASILVLAAAGLLHSRVTRIVGISSLILLWLALGANAGAEQLTHLIPVWGKLRYSEKLVGPLTLCLTVLAAFGTEGLAKRPTRFWAVVAGGAGLAALASALFLANWRGFDSSFTGTVARAAAPVARQNLTIGLVHTGLTLLAFACLVALVLRRAQLRIYFPVAVAALVFLQSSFAAPFAMHSGDRAVRDDHPLAQIAGIGEPPRVLTPIEKNYLYPEGIDQFDGQIGAQFHLGAPAYNVPSRIDQFNTYTGLRPWRFDKLIRTFNTQFGFQSVLALRLYATTHAIIKDPYFPDETQVAQAASQEGVKVLDNREWGITGWKVPHRPWALFADKVAVASNEKDVLDTLVKTLAREESTVVLEGAPQPETLGAGQILEIVRSSNWLRIEAVSHGDGILVVNDSFWPGWRATIDGNEVPIWRADFLVRAVPWPAGWHVLEMKYDPPEVRIGWFVSLTGALALIALTVFEMRRKRATASTKKNKK